MLEECAAQVKIKINKMKVFWFVVGAAIVVLLFALGSNFLNKQTLYLMTSLPTPFGGDRYYPARLYKVNIEESSFELVRDVVSEQQGVDRVIFNKKAIITSEFSNSARHQVIDTESPLKEIEIDVSEKKCVNCSIVGRNFFKLPDGKLVYGMRFFDGDQKWALRSINLKTMEIDNDQWGLYKYAESSGKPNPIIGGDIFYISVKSDGQVVIPVNKNESVKTNWKVPESIKFNKDDVVAAFVNNDFVLAISSRNNSRLGKDEIGHTRYFVLDKSKNDWRTVDFEGGRTTIGGDGEWIFGSVAGPLRDKQNPGFEQRKPKEASDKFAWSGLYVTGRLFLYNVKTHKQYNIETNQADSEILLVDNMFVYYRVYDAIYRAQIKDKAIDNEKLLIKNDLVRDVHWIFFGPPENIR